jgi:hypothetical protein
MLYTPFYDKARTRVHASMFHRHRVRLSACCLPGCLPACNLRIVWLSMLPHYNTHYLPLLPVWQA